jgi:L-ascorbate metabolism protein UlaG (beta-lactamase superfamily)
MIMKIKHFLYNAFLVEDGKTKIAIDPGKNLWLFKLNSLIPKNEWDGITHVFVTHGDPDHFDYALEMAKKTGAKAVCGKNLVSEFHSQNINKVYKVDVGESIDLEGVRVEGLRAVHGSLRVKLLAGLFEINCILKKSPRNTTEISLGSIKIFKKIQQIPAHNHGTIKLLWGLIKLEKDDIPFARGSIGFKITIGDKTIVNLGDTILQQEWQGLKPDVLMIPIGGETVHNTMNTKEALEAIKIIEPKLVIPVHYNAAFLTQKNINPTDDKSFKLEVEKIGIGCHILQYGEEIIL